MKKVTNKISKKWIQKTRDEFREFLIDTEFPDPDRNGERGATFKYPEWLIMFIVVLSVKFKLKTYVKIYQMAVQYDSKRINLFNIPLVSGS